MLRVEEDKIRIRYAQTLRVGDDLPVLQKLPDLATIQPQPIDLIATIEPKRHTDRELCVKLPASWQPTDLIRTTLELLEPSIQKRNHYLSTKTFPLDRFLSLEQLLGLEQDLNFDRADLHIGQHGKEDWLPAILVPDAGFRAAAGLLHRDGDGVAIWQYLSNFL